jgi:nitrogen fixation/metabolism regulation signal transduction histidine kinase
VRRYPLTALIAVVVAQLALAAPAFAKNGEGLVGETNDKVITIFCLGLVIFFTVVVILGTRIQSRLERRKNAKKAARMRQRVGW